MVIIVTNQSPIGRGLLTRDQADEINRRLLQVITAAGGTVDGLYLCPHHPNAGCDCRKPRPGLLLQAALEHQIDLQRSIMIGDALSDLEAGLAAGIGHIALVRTGRGAQQEKIPEAAQLPPFAVYDTLSQALSDLVPP
jgi:D-glycero-D-manno-heptose 1,7-bisphosphate phosphatase